MNQKYLLLILPVLLICSTCTHTMEQEETVFPTYSDIFPFTAAGLTPPAKGTSPTLSIPSLPSDFSPGTPILRPNEWEESAPCTEDQFPPLVTNRSIRFIIKKETNEEDFFNELGRDNYLLDDLYDIKEEDETNKHVKYFPSQNTNIYRKNNTTPKYTKTHKPIQQAAPPIVPQKRRKQSSKAQQQTKKIKKQAQKRRKSRLLDSPSQHQSEQTKKKTGKKRKRKQTKKREKNSPPTKKRKKKIASTGRLPIQSNLQECFCGFSSDTLEKFEKHQLEKHGIQAVFI